MVTVIVSLILTCAQPVAVDDDVTEVLDALDAAMEEARWKLEFYCTYRFRSAVGRSREQAISNLKKASVVQGVMARKGDMFRVSGRSNGPAVWPANFECIDSPTVQLNWYLGPGAGYGLERQPLTIIHSPRAQRNSEGHLYACATVHLDPLFYQGWKDGKVVRRFDPGAIAGKKLIQRVDRPDPTHLIVHSELYQNEKLQVRERATFSIKYRPAVLVRLATFIDERDLGAQYATEFLLNAQQFVKVNAGWLPSRVTAVSGPYSFKDKPEPQWWSNEWVSDDLGKRPPMPEDFVITIPEHVEVRGLKGDYSVGRVRRLDMNTLTLDDVETLPEGVDVDRRPASAEPAGSQLPRPIMVILGAVCVTAVGALIWRARRRRKAG